MSAPPHPGVPAAERERLLEAASVVGAMTLLSRISGLVRDIAFSSWLGAGPVMDAFAVAFKIPNLLRRFFAEGAFAQAFVPVIAEYRTARSAAETRELVDRAAGTLGALLFAVTLLGVLAAPVLVLLFAPGFAGDDGRLDLTSAMLRWTFPYLLFISLTALAGAILNAHRRFAAAAFTPVLLNVVLLLFGALVEPRVERPGLGIAMGVFAAGLVQLAFQIPFLLRLRLLPRPRWGLAHEGVKRILRLMTPALFGSSIVQISVLLDTFIASLLAAGSISWLYYSDRLIEFPLGIFGIAVATAILPRLAEHHARASADTFSATLDWALKAVLLVTVPAALGLALLAQPLIATLFYRGAFGETDVAMAAASLVAYAPGLVGFVLVKVLAPGYFARHDTRTPVRAAVTALGVGLVLNVVLAVTLTRTGWAPAHAGIAAATACSGACNAALLLRGLVRSGVYRRRPGWGRLAAQIAGGSIAMAAGLTWALTVMPDWREVGPTARAGLLLACVGGGVVVYFAACSALGFRFRDLRLRAAP